jgi:haloacetate dehalogenase
LPSTPLFTDDFPLQEVAIDEGMVRLRQGGRGPTVVLLHGFPETHVAWHAVAPLLAKHFTLILPDLPGYGDSIGPRPDHAHERYSKRAMASMLVQAIDQLGVQRFALVGHDRGARVAYRLALDHAERVSALAVLDVIPTLDVAERTTYQTARQMANWFWLATAPPLPERLLSCEPELYVRQIVDAWGGSRAIVSEALAEYVRCFRNPRVIEAICAEYRAGDVTDIEHDQADRKAGRRISCPVLALWEENGFVTHFGDPLTIWRGWADNVTGGAVAGGHFMMEESPVRIAEALREFLAGLSR